METNESPMMQSDICFFQEAIGEGNSCNPLEHNRSQSVSTCEHSLAENSGNVTFLSESFISISDTSEPFEASQSGDDDFTVSSNLISLGDSMCIVNCDQIQNSKTSRGEGKKRRKPGSQTGDKRGKYNCNKCGEKCLLFILGRWIPHNCPYSLGKTKSTSCDAFTNTDSKFCSNAHYYSKFVPRPYIPRLSDHPSPTVMSDSVDVWANQSLEDYNYYQQSVKGVSRTLKIQIDGHFCSLISKSSPQTCRWQNRLSIATPISVPTLATRTLLPYRRLVRLCLRRLKISNAFGLVGIN